MIKILSGWSFRIFNSALRFLVAKLTEKKKKRLEMKVVKTDQITVSRVLTKVPGNEHPLMSVMDNTQTSPLQKVE